MPVFSRRAAGELIDEKTGKRQPVPPSQVLRLVGPLIRIELRPSLNFLKALKDKDPQKARQVEGKGKIMGHGLIDTGASHTAIDAEISTVFHLEPINVTNTATPSDAKYETTIYAGLEFYIPDGNIVVETSVAGLQLKNQGIQALIGRDLLQHGIFVYNGHDGSFSFAV